MNDTPPIPAAIAAVPSLAVASTVTPGSGEGFEARKLVYVDKFHDWMMGLNKHDYLQAKKLLDAMMAAYTKHTMKIHSPPAKDESNVSSETSPGAPDPNLPPEGAA